MRGIESVTEMRGRLGHRKEHCLAQQIRSPGATEADMYMTADSIRPGTSCASITNNNNNKLKEQQRDYANEKNEKCKYSIKCLFFFDPGENAITIKQQTSSLTT